MKKTVFSLLTVAALLLSLTACSLPSIPGSSERGLGTESSALPVSRAADTDVSAAETDGEFSITTSDGEYQSSGTTYTITSAGTYTLSGRLDGQILVNAGESDDVVLELNGVTISDAEDSPIKILSAGNAEITVKKDSENVVKDIRAVKTSDDDSLGKGAIYAKADLKLNGEGTLVVSGEYNNGIHTTKDLTIEDLTLKVTAYNNAIKGNDSVTVLNGTVVVAISTNGDAVKTENTDADKKGNTRGDIILTGGNVSVYAAGDGFQAAHDFVMSEEEGSTPSVRIYTGSYSAYTAESATTDSYKGVKVQNELSISAGEIEIQSYDDGLHADYGTSFTAGGKGQGTVRISGGTITMNVYAPSTKTGGGRMGPGGGSGGFGMPGGWSGQQTVSGADAIHADYQLIISGGTITIDSAYEGLEANVITVSGGKTTVTASDDGVNACKGVTTPSVNVTGGYLDVTVSPNGDTDGIDSNGTYTQTGGIVIVRGPNSQMAAALDTEGTATVTGGTLIVLGYAGVSAAGSVRTYSLSLHSSGEHTVIIDGTAYTFNNSASYGRTTCYSSVSVTD